MLYVLFQLGKDRYALEAKRVVEIVPLMTMHALVDGSGLRVDGGKPSALNPQPSTKIRLMVYRGRAIPVVDLSELTQGQPARERMSTRIIIVNYSGEEDVNAERGTRKAEARVGSSEFRVPSAELRTQNPESSTALEGGDGDQTDSGKRPTSAKPPAQPGSTNNEQRTTRPELLGLIAERATEMLRRDTAEVDCSASQLAGLGPVLVDERGVIQLLQPQKLLAEKERELLGRIWPVEKSQAK